MVFSLKFFPFSFQGLIFHLYRVDRFFSAIFFAFIKGDAFLRLRIPEMVVYFFLL